MITFANKELLFLLFLLIPYAIWYILRHKRHEASITISDTHGFLHIRPSMRMRFIHTPFVLRLITLALIIIILARPQGKNSWKNSQVEGIDIMLVLDASTSMLAEDLQPNRIEAAKSVATEFISSRPNDNIGLTVFAAEAFTQCPMTVDHAALLGLMQHVSCNMALHGLIDDGTAIGMGITNAVSRLKDSKAKSKIIILLTDGSNNRGEISPLTAADIASSYGIRVYTIGVGTNGQAPFPYPMPGGGVHYIQMPCEIDAQTLQGIALATGGQFYRATSTKELKKVYKDIDTLEKTKFSVRKYSKRYELYQPLAMVAIFTLLLEVLLRMTLFRRLP